MKQQTWKCENNVSCDNSVLDCGIKFNMPLVKF